MGDTTLYPIYPRVFMPSAFAHGLVGASLVSLLPRGGRTGRVALVLAALAAAPDLDVLAFRLGIPYAHPLGHRGASHSLAFGVLAGLASLPFWRLGRSPRPGLLALLTGISVVSHGLLDTLTNAGLGVGLLIPFENGRYFAPWRPILTSPLSPGAFFSARGLEILGNEALWVGAPVLVLLLLAAGIRGAWGVLRGARGAAG